MELSRLKCPVCHSADIHHHSPYTTKNHGGRVIYKCEHCPVYFSETKKTLMEGLKTPLSVIWQILKARTEGMGLNAAARTFEKAKNTILNRATGDSYTHAAIRACASVAICSTAAVMSGA